MRKIYMESGREAFTDITNGKRYELTELEIYVSHAELFEMIADAAETPPNDSVILRFVGASRVTKSRGE